MAKYQTLNDIFILKLRSLYDIESELVKALPKMAKAAADPELASAFTEHLKQTKGHVDRLEQSFKLIDYKAAKTKVEAIRGLVADAAWIIDQDISAEALDSLLIAAASYIEHYEIAGYSSVIKWARLIGQDDVANLLEETLREEEEADDKLVSLADENIDERAVALE